MVSDCISLVQSYIIAHSTDHQAPLAPKQKNTYDCGVFLCMVSYHLSNMNAIATLV